VFSAEQQQQLHSPGEFLAIIVEPKHQPHEQRGLQRGGGILGGVTGSANT
jgi:hypothetical protein